jgi:outer membrane protein assembly factor BamB
MKSKRINRNFSIFLVGLFILPLFTPMTNHGDNNRYTNDVYVNHCLPQGYEEKTPSKKQINTTKEPNTVQKESAINLEIDNKGPMNSPWPMYNHDNRHTGLSPYNTANNPLIEKWRFPMSTDCFYAGLIIDSNGIIYGGSAYIYAINSNGTMKWAYPTYGIIESTPAIEENGIVYIGTIWAWTNYLHAIYSNNGTQKWQYAVGNDIDSSPAIDSDGIIYFGDWSGNVHAVNSNGTRKWTYHTGDVITSSPAIGNDGIIYIGSHDDYIYALNSNGTVKWRYQTGNWVHASPTIGPDGTIYIGSDDGYLYALNPNNGSMIWRCPTGYTWCSPSLGPDGTIYLGVWEMKFYAVNPNGTIKWTYNAPGRIWFGSSATVSSDGTIFFGTTTQDGGSGALIALNPNGTERFRDNYGYYATSPAIGEDGTVYAASFDYEGMIGHLHAFGSLNPNAPIAPTITSQTNGKIKKTYTYTFTSTSPLENKLYYLIDWGDGTNTDWTRPYTSGETLTVTHSWQNKGTYLIQARAKDTDNLWGPWGTLSVTMPCSYEQPFLSFFDRFLERFPYAFPVVRHILNQINRLYQ